MSVEKVTADLADVVQGDVYADIFTRAAFSTDASIYQIMPLCVVAVRDSADVSAVVKYAGNNNIPIVARGAGSGVAGESLCSGIVLDMTRYMNNIVSIDESKEEVVCQSGVVLDELNEFLLPFDKKIGPDPSSGNRATVGGCVANNATGAHCLQYGYISEYVTGIEAVLADGSIVEFGNDFMPVQADQAGADAIGQKCLSLLSAKAEIIAKALPRTKRNRSGYNIAGICHNGRIDMAKLLASSEGTLAIFTKIRLRTVDIPAAKALVQFEFDSFEKLAEAVPIVVQTGAAACELMDKTLCNMAVEAFPEYSDILPTEATATLLVEHNGQTIEQVREKIEKTDSAVGELACGRVSFFDLQMQKQLWKSRKDAVPLLYQHKSDKQAIPFVEDVSVDNTQLGRYFSGLDEIFSRYNTSTVYYGHAGDGVLHVRPCLDLHNVQDIEKMRMIAEDVFALAWSLGGTISGEHGDGLVRSAFIKRQYGDEYYELLKQIKQIFDPDNLMNPGKIINDDVDVMVRNLRAEHRALPERLKTNLLFESDEFRLEVQQCTGDGLCRSKIAGARMCPVFRALGEELACSRAKANILRFWLTGFIGDEDFESAEFKKILDLCINCKMCSVECPSGVDISKLIIEARAEYVRRKGLSRTAFVLSHNRYLSRLSSLFVPVSNIMMSLKPFKLILEKAIGVDRRRSFPSFESSQLIKKASKYLANCARISRPVDKVAYFVDSYANYNNHKLGMAVVKTLRHNDIEVIVPKQLPAPMSAIAYGDIKTAYRDLSYSVKYFAEAVRSGYKIVCSEPSAALCLKEELSLILDDEQARLVSANTYELMSYLLGLSKKDKLKAVECEISRSFVYHLPCHVCVLGAAGAGIELLRKLCSVSIEQLNSGCCGLAGTFGMQSKNYELSVKMGGDMVEQLNAARTDYALTECSACRMQIEYLTDKKICHPIEILAEAYRIDC